MAASWRTPALPAIWKRVSVVLVEALLPVQAERARSCILTPFYVDLVCYRVLAANADPRAEPVLARARQRLHETAGQMAEPALR